MQKILNVYTSQLEQLTSGALVTDSDQNTVEANQAFETIITRCKASVADGYKIIFAGNGGSAGITSHMATDWSKNGGLRAMAMNDGSMLTCLGNDYGYEHVFSKQIEFHGREKDILFAISSSGNSQNILNAVEAARQLGIFVYTLSGFEKDNKLRKTGDLNFYINSSSYGYVEVGHLTILHAILDHSMGLVVG